MAWHPNGTMTTSKQSSKSSMYIEYSNLIKELKEYMPQFNASIKDLQEPSQTFVTNFYTDVLSEFFCDVNNLTEIQVTQNLTYHEMYGETVPVLNMCTALRYMYSKLGIDDFGLNDICDPSPRRTYRLLQTMINFIKYSDEKIHEADAKMKAVRNIKEKCDNLKKEKDILVNSINQKSLNRKERKTEIKTLSDEIKESKANFTEIDGYKSEIHHELEKLNQEKSEIETTCFKLSELRDNVLKDITTLRGQIVEAPDLLKADHERFKRLKNETAEKKSAMMAQVTAKKLIVITLEQELAAQEKRFNLLVDVTEKNNRLCKLVQEFEILSQNKCEMEESKQNLQEKIELIKRQRADINKEINDLVKQMDRERNTFKSNYDVLLKARDNLVKEKKDHCGSIKLLDSQINKYYAKKHEIETEVEVIIENFRNDKSALIKRHDEFMNKVMYGINGTKYI